VSDVCRVPQPVAGRYAFDPVMINAGQLGRRWAGRRQVTTSTDRSGAPSRSRRSGSQRLISERADATSWHRAGNSPHTWRKRSGLLPSDGSAEVRHSWPGPDLGICRSHRQRSRGWNSLADRLASGQPASRRSEAGSGLKDAMPGAVHGQGRPTACPQTGGGRRESPCLPRHSREAFLIGLGELVARHSHENCGSQSATTALVALSWRVAVPGSER